VTDPPRRARIVRTPGVVASAIAGLTDVVYLAAIARQGTSPDGAVVAFVGSLIAVAAVCAATSEVVASVRTRTLLVSFAAGGLLALGIFGIFSIGILLLAAALFAVVSMLRAVKAGGAAALAIGFHVVGIIVAVAGLAIVNQV
jgi:hypothetical protein